MIERELNEKADWSVPFVPVNVSIGTKIGCRSRSAEAMGTPSLDGSSGSNSVSKSRRILTTLRRISTTPLRHQPGSSGRRRSSSSSSDSSCSSAPPKLPAKPSPLRSAAAAAARKTRRLFGAKSNEILPGILLLFSFLCP